jgi:D-aminopeptidase
VLSFSTANGHLPAEDLEPKEPFETSITMVVNAHLSALFEATADATESAILDALFAAETMIGADGATAVALPLDIVRAALD